MKKIGLNDKCIGCGATLDDPECDCEWATCSWGYPDCWIRPNGTWHCENCDLDTDHRAYDW